VLPSSPTNGAAPAQVRLSDTQIEAFYHDQFVKDQVGDFMALVGPQDVRGRVVVDVGGGCGFFAKSLRDATLYSVRVIDSDTRSVEACRQIGVQAECEDALNPRFSNDEGVACFNLILHHLVGPSEKATVDLQCKALALWKGRAPVVFVNEYIYESFLPNVSGRLIFEITKSSILSSIGKLLARLVPAFRANTFGVGVRFRSHSEWRRLFARAGYTVVDSRVGASEDVSPALRLLLIRQIRRDSFLLIAKA
jgi:hypothetical protein